jgi:flagellar biosynthesis anti-sigma factor FlgM
MKISGIRRPYVDANTTARPAAPPGGASPATKVAVSAEAKQLAEARAPEVADTAKVERLSIRVARGDFMVDAEEVADRMLAEES